MRAPLVLAGIAGALGLGAFALRGTAHAATKPAPSSAPGGRPTLRNGSSGSPVAELQQRLNAQGETLTVDGKFGSLTEAAVKRFQSRTADPATGQPLVVDGIVGPKTWSALLATGGAA